MKEAWFRLSEEERKEFVDKAMKDVEEVGGKWIAHCNCYWSNEEWVWFGCMKFPDIEAVQKHAKAFWVFLHNPKFHSLCPNLFRNYVYIRFVQSNFLPIDAAGRIYHLLSLDEMVS